MNTLSNFYSDHRGSMTLQMGLTFAMVLGALGATVDVSRANNDRAAAQRALDTAALSAAGIDMDTADERADYAESLFASTAPSSCTASFEVGDANVSAAASCQTATTMMRVFGFENLETKVAAGAQTVEVPTGEVDTSNACVILVLEDSEKEALYLNSNSGIDARNCLVQVNSTNREAIYANSGGSIEADRICVGGGAVENGGTLSPAPELDCAPMEDPFASLAVPANADAACDYNDLTVEGRATLTPGVYCKKLELNSGSEVTFEPGTYVIRNAELIVNSGSKMTAEGVTLFFTGDDDSSGFNFNSGSSVTITAPVTGDYAGTAIYQDRDTGDDNESIINSGSDIDIVGAIYMPESKFTLNSEGNYLQDSSWTTVIVNTLELNSDSVLYVNDDYEASHVPVPGPLVEPLTESIASLAF